MPLNIHHGPQPAWRSLTYFRLCCCRLPLPEGEPVGDNNKPSRRRPSNDRGTFPFVKLVAESTLAEHQVADKEEEDEEATR